MRLTKEDREGYARAIWDTFCKLSHQQRDMSCAEWYVLSGWLDRDIPLPVVLRAFRDFQGVPRRLEALEGPVNRAYAYYRQALAL